MSSTKQRSAARRNIKKAVAAAKRKRTIAHLPKSMRTALGKQASSVAWKKRLSRSSVAASWLFSSKVAGLRRNCLENAVVADVHDPEQFDPRVEKKSYKLVPGFHLITTRDISRASRPIAGC